MLCIAAVGRNCGWPDNQYYTQYNTRPQQSNTGGHGSGQQRNSVFFDEPCPGDEQQLCHESVDCFAQLQPDERHAQQYGAKRDLRFDYDDACRDRPNLEPG